ncbi:DUF6286 domain-containing protein [Streptomyces sp. NPDC005438]|uniref:DUF6286 domain-containing protein n=1 Tax=Streptomyces sp. NPDC005438 TaxID=3156880 RepID=UPI0033A2DABD
MTKPQPTGPPGEPPPPEPAPGRAGRFWATRRGPALVVAALVLLATGALLYDVVAVRLGNDARSWRADLADELATRTVDDPWVIAGAVVAVLLGLWLLLLAVTPGRRSLLPMRRIGPVRAGLDRRAAAQSLRDLAMAVPGVRLAHVRVGRGRVRVGALAHFRELPQVREELEATLQQGVERLDLARVPRLQVRVRRPVKG